MVQDVTRNFIAPLGNAEDLSLAAFSAPTNVADSAELGTSENINAINSIIRAVDSPLRVRMLLALHERPHFVSELVSLVGSSQPLVSQHLKVLKAANLVSADRNGRQMSYSLAQPLVIDLLKVALEAAEATSA